MVRAVALCAAGLVVLGGLLGCAPSAPVSERACVPDAVAPWLAAPPLAAGGSGEVRLYADRSGSMAGYLRPSDAALRPFEDALRLLPQQVSERGDRLSAAWFGRTIQPLDTNAFGALVDPTSYRCGGVAKADCESVESHIDAVLAEIAKSPPDRLSVVVTDLWLVNSELAASGPVALGTQFSELFNQGRSIDIVGVRAPYSGAITDLPRTGTYRGATERPLFILLVGPVDRVEAYRTALTASGSPAFMPERVRHALFTRRLLADPAPPGDLRLRNAGAGLTKTTVLAPDARLAAPQYLLSRGAALQQPDAARRAQLEVRLPAAPPVREGAVWTGDMTPRVRVWALADEGAFKRRQCRPEVWRPMGELPGGWRREPAAGGRPGAWVYALNAAEAVRLAPGQTYLLLGEVRRERLETPNPTTAWLRDWSFDFTTEDRVIANQPTFFPTLNLAQTAAVLEASLQRSTLASRDAVSAFALAVKSTD